MSYTYKYPHPAVTTDCVLFGYKEEQLYVLLIQRGRDPYKGCWAFPGGFLNIEESAEEGALRELQEETGITGVTLHQFHTFTDPNRDSRERVISIAYYGVMDICEVKGDDDAADARWFPTDNLPPLAFDHEEMLMLAMKALLNEK